MWILLVVVLSILSHVIHVEGFGSGAPAARCGDMLPSHGIPAQTSAIPYTFTSPVSTYSPGGQVTLTLGGGSFNGYLIIATDAAGQYVGSMNAPAGATTVGCGGIMNSGLTHSSKVTKNNVIFQWDAPATDRGDISFFVTVVQSYTDYWVRRSLLTLSPEATVPVTPSLPLPQTSFVSPQLTTGVTSLTTTQLTTQGGNILYDDDCGSSKGCFVKCSDQQCEFMVTWRDVGSGVQFELYGRPGFPNAWIAVGFSDDTKMGGDSVVECVSNNGMVQAFNSENTGYSNRRMNPAQMGLSSMYGTYSNGILYCTFVRQKFMPSMPSMHDLESDWNIMFALGETFNVPAWTIRMHDTSVLPPVSASKVDFQSFDVIGSGVTYKLVKAHGCLMILAWVLFTGIGLVVARYYKNVWADKTFLKLKIWFQVHRACMVVAVLLNVIAFVIIFIDVDGYSEINVPGKSYLKSHPVLGIIVTGLCLANPIMAFFRPGPDSKKRPIFNWAHWGVGMTAYILSAICICFGFQLGKSSTPDYAIYIMIVYILHIIIFDIVFEVLDCMLKRQKKVKYVINIPAKVENVEMSTQNGTDTPIPNGHYQTKQSRKSEDRLKTALLLLHLAFTGAFALVLVLVVALN